MDVVCGGSYKLQLRAYERLDHIWFRFHTHSSLLPFQFTHNPMANHDDKNDKHEESSPLLGNQLGEEDAKKAGKPTDAKSEVTVEKAPAPVPVNFGRCGWPADGLPLGHGSVVGEPMGRTHWDSSLFACFGSSDAFCSSDLEVCESFRFFFFFLSYDWDFGILWFLGISTDIFSFFVCLGFQFGLAISNLLFHFKLRSNLNLCSCIY